MLVEDIMSMINNKKRINEIIEQLPDYMLTEILNFAEYLKEKTYREDYTRLQINSNSYKEWTSNENDIYDEVFKDEV
jgi:hypothetical protein